MQTCHSVMADSRRSGSCRGNPFNSSRGASRSLTLASLCQLAAVYTADNGVMHCLLAEHYPILQ